MNSFTSKIQDGEAKPFEATYVTTGDNPTTVVYAVQPPKGLSFTNTSVECEQRRHWRCRRAEHRHHRELDG